VVEKLAPNEESRGRVNVVKVRREQGDLQRKAGSGEIQAKRGNPLKEWGISANQGRGQEPKRKTSA